MKKAMSLLTATAMAATLLQAAEAPQARPQPPPLIRPLPKPAARPQSLCRCSRREGKVLSIWCWNDEFQSRFNDYYPGVKVLPPTSSHTTLDNGVTVKWTINPNDSNNYQK